MLVLSISKTVENGFTSSLKVLMPSMIPFRFFSLHSSSACSWVCRLSFVRLEIVSKIKRKKIFYGELKYLNYGFTRIVFCFDLGRSEIMRCVAVFMLRIPVVMPFLSRVITIIIQKRERPPRNVSSDKEMIPKMGFVWPRLASKKKPRLLGPILNHRCVYEWKLSNNTRNKSSLSFFSPA